MSAFISLLFFSSFSFKLCSDLFNHLFLQGQYIQLRSWLLIYYLTLSFIGFINSWRLLKFTRLNKMFCCKRISDWAKIVWNHKTLWLSSKGFEMIRSLIGDISCFISFLQARFERVWHRPHTKVIEGLFASKVLIWAYLWSIKLLALKLALLLFSFNF